MEPDKERVLQEVLQGLGRSARPPQQVNKMLTPSSAVGFFGNYFYLTLVEFLDFSASDMIHWPMNIILSLDSSAGFYYKITRMVEISLVFLSNSKSNNIPYFSERPVN